VPQIKLLKSKFKVRRTLTVASDNKQISNPFFLMLIKGVKEIGIFDFQVTTFGI